MRCAAVQRRLVAWQDRELSPGESVKVSEHLERCPECRAAEARLATVGLLEPVAVPAHIEARLRAATNVDAILTAAADESRRTPFPADPWWQRWLVDGIEVPGWSVLAAAAAVSLLAIWALHTRVELAGTQAELAARAIPLSAGPEAPPIDLPADQFQPAAYQPGEEHGYR